MGKDTSKEILIGGLSDHLTVEDIAKKHNVSVDVIQNQIKKGIEVEKEHTDNIDIATEIATDHVSESPTYYDDLEQMENKEKSSQKYYRAVFTDFGEVTTFHPCGYYEAVGKHNEPLLRLNDEPILSDVMELCASKTSVGALICAISSEASMGDVREGDVVYIYEIDEEPCCDISHWSIKDFQELQEVRYRKAVSGVHKYTVKITNELTKLFSDYYGYHSFVWQMEKSEEAKLPESFKYIEKLIEQDKFTDEVEGLAKLKFEKGGVLSETKKEVADRTYRLAPNGKRSNLSNVQYDLVRSPQFIAWFGDWINDSKNASKVIDENGEPLVCYHATKARKDFHVFEAGEYRLPYFYFAKSYEYALRLFTGVPIHEYFLNIRNVYDGLEFGINEYKNTELLQMVYEKMDKSEFKDMYLQHRIELCDMSNEMETKFEMNGDDQEKFWGIIKLNGMKEVLFKGYDGLVFMEDYGQDLTVAYCCFNNNQMKLADGSNVNFDNNSSDIRFEEGGTTKDNSFVCGKDLINLGYKPSAHFNQILANCVEAQNKGIITDKESGIKWVCDNYMPKLEQFEEGGTFNKCGVGTEVQSLLFAKEYYTKKEAKKWLKLHGYKTDLDENTHTLRYRQKEPSNFEKKSFRTIYFTKGLQAVIGCPIEKKEEGGTIDTDLKKKLIGTVSVAKENVNIYDVDATVVRTAFVNEYAESVDWNSGGHNRGWGKGMEFIPDGEIWIDSSATEKAKGGFIVHELCEYYLMKVIGYNYEIAHSISNTFEQEYLEAYDNMLDKDPLHYLEGLDEPKDEIVKEDTATEHRYRFIDTNVEGKRLTRLIRGLDENGLYKNLERISDTEAIFTIETKKFNSDLFKDIIDFCIKKEELVKLAECGGNITADEFIERCKELHQNIKSVTLTDGTVIDGKELMEKTRRASA